MSSWLTLSPTEEDVAERIEQVQTDVQQTETSQTTEEREISTTQQHNVPETEGQLMGAEHRVTPPPTAPVAQRLLRARSHLAPFSFPQVGFLVYLLVGVSHVALYYLKMFQVVLLFCPNRFYQFWYFGSSFIVLEYNFDGYYRLSHEVATNRQLIFNRRQNRLYICHLMWYDGQLTVIVGRVLNSSEFRMRKTPYDHLLWIF